MPPIAKPLLREAAPVPCVPMALRSASKPEHCCPGPQHDLPVPSIASPSDSDACPTAAIPSLAVAKRDPSQSFPHHPLPSQTPAPPCPCLPWLTIANPFHGGPVSGLPGAVPCRCHCAAVLRQASACHSRCQSDHGLSGSRLSTATPELPNAAPNHRSAQPIRCAASANLSESITRQPNATPILSAATLCHCRPLLHTALAGPHTALAGPHTAQAIQSLPLPPQRSPLRFIANPKLPCAFPFLC